MMKSLIVLCSMVCLSLSLQAQPNYYKIMITATFDVDDSTNKFLYGVTRDRSMVMSDIIILQHDSLFIMDSLRTDTFRLNAPSPIVEDDSTILYSWDLATHYRGRVNTIVVLTYQKKLRYYQLSYFDYLLGTGEAYELVAMQGKEEEKPPAENGDDRQTYAALLPPRKYRFVP